VIERLGLPDAPLPRSAPSAAARPERAGTAVNGDAESSAPATGGQGVAGARRGVSRAEAEKVRQAARDFEALMLGQMLRSMRQASLPGSSPLTGQGQRLYQEVMDDEVARTLAKSGGLGLADMIARDLLRRAPETKIPSSPVPGVPITPDRGAKPREETSR
jgi:Rod binding domain-containing protein